MSCIKICGVLALIAIFTTISAKSGYGHGEQEWGFVDIRKGAHMFYWLYKTTAKVSHYTERPLAIWLQGGPGDSSTGFGNFCELGPVDLSGNIRNSTWVEEMNVLFVDSPVGSGFSYVDFKKFLAVNNSQIVSDLLKFTKRFYEKHPEFVNVPLHIFGESYGGKVAAGFSLELYNAIQRNEINCKLTSVTFANPLISTVDTIFAWAPQLFIMSIIDQDGFNHIQSSVNKMFGAIQKDDWSEVKMYFIKTTNLIKTISNGVDFYNILKPHRLDSSNITTEGEQLETLMRGPVSTALGIPSNVVWGSQNENTFRKLQNNFLKPVNQTVNDLLSKTDLKVNVISGQLDFLCATIGTVNWINKLNWLHRDKYVNAPRMALSVDGVLEGYEKSGGNLSMFWVFRAGHMATADNPAAISHIVKKITNIQN